jgi:transcriptional repressor NrdR
MKCFFCGSNQSSVIDKRAVVATGEIRRRRICLKCGNRFTTYERVAGHELCVIKRDGTKESFDRNKLVAGVEKALEKRPALDSLSLIVDQIIEKIKVKGKKEIESKVLGQIVLLELKKIDKVAYLRFASVYRQFQDPSDFKKELDHLKVA